MYWQSRASLIRPRDIAMLKSALKMLIGNKASCIGVIFGIFLATLLISQQSAIFLGLIARSYRLVTDIPIPDVWIMDPATESDDKVRGIPLELLDIVRSVPGVEWAVPINVADIPMVTPSGEYEITELYGIDDKTFIGAPLEIVEGDVRDLRRDGAVIVDIYSAEKSLAKRMPDGSIVPLKLGDTFEINQHRAEVVALSKITQAFYPQPIIFTANSSFREFLAYPSDKVGFIAARTFPGSDVDEVIRKINTYPGLKALTKDRFEWRIAEHFLETGILINFALSVALGLIIGFSIAGQIFYIMTLQNLSYYALIKALGGTNRMILQMIIVQALTVGAVGYLLGTGVTLLWGIAIKDTALAFLFPWQLLLFTAFIVLIICLFTATLSIKKVFKTDPKTLMGN